MLDDEIFNKALSINKKTTEVFLQVTNLEVHTFLGAYYLQNENLERELSSVLLLNDPKDFVVL